MKYIIISNVKLEFACVYKSLVSYISGPGALILLKKHISKLYEGYLVFIYELGRYSANANRKRNNTRPRVSFIINGSLIHLNLGLYPVLMYSF